MAQKRGRIWSDDTTINCPECGVTLELMIDGEWKDGDKDGRTVYSQPFICPSCNLMWGVRVQVKGFGPVQQVRRPNGDGV